MLQLRRVGRLLVAAGAVSGLMGGTGALDAIVTAGPAFAASCSSFTWTGAGVNLPAGNDDWSNGANWSGLTAPASGGCVDLTFPGTYNGPSNNDVANLGVHALSLDGNDTLTGDAIAMVSDGAANATVTASTSASSDLGLRLEDPTNTTFTSTSGTLDLTGQITTGTAGANPTSPITVSGSGGSVSFGAINTFTGPISVSGTLVAANPSALGSGANAVTVPTGGTLELNATSGSVALAQPVTLTGGTVLGQDPADSLTGPISVGSAGTLASTGTFAVSGVLSGTGSLLIGTAGSAGTVQLDGTAANTYQGGTTVAAGTLELSGSQGPSAPGNLTVNSGATLSFGAGGQLDPAGQVSVLGTGHIDLTGTAQSLKDLTLNSNSASGVPSVTDTVGSGHLTVSDKITSQGPDAPASIAATVNSGGNPQAPATIDTINSLRVSGALTGPFALNDTSTTLSPCASGTSANTCLALAVTSATSAASVRVDSGVLDVARQAALGGPVNVNGGTLTGSGSVGDVTLTSGTLAPGTTVTVPAGAANFSPADQPGVLAATNLTLNGGTILDRLDGNTPGDGHTTCAGFDRIGVGSGQAVIGAGLATLNVLSDTTSGHPCYVPAKSDAYDVIDATTSGAGTDHFANQASQGGGQVLTGTESPYPMLVTFDQPPGGSVVLTPAVTDSVGVTLSSGVPTYGERLRFTANVNPTGATGTVTFSDTDNGTAVPNFACAEGNGTATVTLSSGAANCTPTAAVPGGSNVIEASYSGDSLYPATSGSLHQAVDQQTTSTSLSDGASGSTSFGTGVQLTATVTGTAPSSSAAQVAKPSGTVTFRSGGQALADCTAVAVVQSTGVAQCTSDDLPGGVDSLTALYNGDGNYSTSTSQNSVSQTVTAAPTTTTISQTSPNSSVFGQQVTITATIAGQTNSTAPTGTVTFSAGGSAIPDCSALPVSTTAGTTSATCQTTGLPVGDDSLTAGFTSGDGNYEDSATAGATSYTVGQAATTTTVTGTPAPSAPGEQVTYTATVAVDSPGAGAPTGTVSFTDNGSAVSDCTDVAVATSDGSTTAQCSETYQVAGAHALVGTYSGDSDFTGSTGDWSQTVSSTNSTTAITAGSPSPSVFGDAVTFTATVHPASGTIQPTGTVTFQANGNALPDCTGLSLSAGSGSTATADCDTTRLPAGADNISASYSGDGVYLASSSSNVSQTVARASTYVLVFPDHNPGTVGHPETVAAFVGTRNQDTGRADGTAIGQVTFKFAGRVLCGPVALNSSAVASCTTSALPAGFDKITVTYGGSANYAGSAQAVTVRMTLPTGYLLVTRTGRVSSFGGAVNHGSVTGALDQPIVGMAVDPLTGGYWLVAADGGIFAFDAPYLGSTGGVHLNKPIVGIAATPDGRGYWLVASDGGIFTFGDARYFGSTGAVHLTKPIVAMAATPDGRGYFLVGSDGGIFTFGDARYHGSTGGMSLAKPIVAIAVDPATGGYWLVASDGRLFAFDAPNHGSEGGSGLPRPIVGLAVDYATDGYWLVGGAGAVYSFDAPSLGSAAAGSQVAAISSE